MEAELEWDEGKGPKGVERREKKRRGVGEKGEKATGLPTVGCFDDGKSTLCLTQLCDNTLPAKVDHMSDCECPSSTDTISLGYTD